MKILVFLLHINYILCQWLRSRQERVNAADIITAIEKVTVTSCQLKCVTASKCNAIGLQKKAMLGKEQQCYLLKIDENKSVPTPDEKSLMLYVISKIPPPCPSACQQAHCGIDNISPSECSKFKEKAEPGMSKDTAIPSCKWLKDNHPDSSNGFYWTYHWNFTRIFCDMRTDGGGWVLFANYTVQTGSESFDDALEVSPSALTKMENETNVVLTSQALKELKKAMNATQFRIFCRKRATGRSVHITSARNALGLSVLPFFSSESNDIPGSCGSYETLQGDNSELSKLCGQWNYRGLWSKNDFAARRRIYDYTMFVANKYHVILDSTMSLCDDKYSANNDMVGNWQYFIR